MNWLRPKLAGNTLLRGAWLSLGSPVAAEMAGSAGFDWLLFDLEHGVPDYQTLLHQLQAVGRFDIGSLVRVPGIDGRTFKHILDLGPQGLMIPNIATAEEAAEVVSLARIPPLGVRGAAQTTRASGYGPDYEQYVREVNNNIVVAVQIESQRGVDNASAIAAVDGVDILFIGPLDLSIDLGTEAERPRGEFRKAVITVAEAARQHGKTLGVLVRNLEQARDYYELGYTFIALGSDRGLIGSGMRRNAANLRSLIEEPGADDSRRAAQ